MFGNGTRTSTRSSTRASDCARSPASSGWPAIPSAASPTPRTPDELLVGRWTGRPSILDPYKPYLHQRWAEGCTVARRLFEEVRERGYPGGENVVKKYVAKLRESFPHDPPSKAPSVRNVTSRLTRHPDRLTDDQTQQLKAILVRCPALDRTAHHVRAFAELMNNRQGTYLDQWITPVAGSSPCS
ncbi:hypothetical protein ACFVFJ_48465 [Streptomyces sp. NPDC057717]|uniref:hypothetical protein n=1 Tax=Streptomyces sp. NPDC057717 TaxID=3346224 RepID=UPI003694999D